MACKKTEIISDNDPPNLDNVPTVLIENYINRIFIDLIGREPFKEEMDSNVAFFKANDLNIEARAQLIERLQTDTSWIEGDTSYKHAYYNRVYESAKVKMIEGDGDSELRRWIGLAEITIYRDSLSGDTVPGGNYISTAQAQLRIEKLQNVLNIQREYRNGIIEIDEIFRRLANNYIYDQINMNTFNFINATFDDIFYRFPTQNERDMSWEMIENNNSVNLFGVNGQNKGDYLNIITSSKEFYQGMIMWAYYELLARPPKSAEVNEMIDQFYLDKDFQRVQKEIMITNDYANF